MNSQIFLNRFKELYELEEYNKLVPLIHQHIPELLKSSRTISEHYKDYFYILPRALIALNKSNRLQNDDETEISIIINGFISLYTNLPNQINYQTYLKPINFFAKDPNLKQCLPVLLHSKTNRQLLIQLLQLVTKNFQIENPTNDLENIYIEITWAATVFLQFDETNNFDVTYKFLSWCEQLDVWKKNNFIGLCFQLLMSFVKSLKYSNDNDFQRNISNVLEKLQSINNNNKFETDTIITISNFVRITEKVLSSHLTQNNIKVLLAFFDCLLKKISSINCIKFCNLCAFKGNEYNGLHELNDVMSVALNIFYNGISKGIIFREQIQSLSHQLVIKLLRTSNYKCENDQNKEFKHFIKLTEICKNKPDQADLAIAFLKNLLDKYNDGKGSNIDVQLNLLHILYVLLKNSNTFYFDDINEIVYWMLTLYNNTTIENKFRIEERIIDFFLSVSDSHSQIKTPYDYYNQTERILKYKIKMKIELDSMSLTTVMLKVFNQLENPSDDINIQMIKQIINDSENCCILKRFQFLIYLRLRYSNLVQLRDSIKLDFRGIVNCCDHHNEDDKHFIHLLKTSLELLDYIKNMEKIFERQELKNITHLHIRGEIIWSCVLTFLSESITKCLQFYENRKISRGSPYIDNIQFCFRAITFIKDTTLLFDNLQYTFKSLPNLAGNITDDITMIKLGTILCEYCDEYDNEVDAKLLKTFIAKCDKCITSLKRPKRDIQNYNLSSALYHKRNHTNICTMPELLNDILNNEIVLKYKIYEIMQSENDCVGKCDLLIKYLKAIKKSNIYPKCNAVRLLNAISKIDLSKLLAKGHKDKVKELLDEAMSVCMDLNIKKQIINILFLQISTNLINREWLDCKENIKLISSIYIPHEALIATTGSNNSLPHLSVHCQCEICKYPLLLFYQFKLFNYIAEYFYLNPNNEMINLHEELYSFWNKKVYKTVENNLQYRNCVGEMIMRCDLLKIEIDWEAVHAAFNGSTKWKEYSDQMKERYSKIMS